MAEIIQRVPHNYSVDIMHDVLSGVFKYDIREILKKNRGESYIREPFIDSQTTVLHSKEK